MREYTYWTPEEDTRLKTLWATGMPFSAMAKEFNRTRGSVIGRAFRLGLLTRTSKLQVSHGSVR